MRVAERPLPERGWVSTLVGDPAGGGERILRVRANDPELRQDDPRLFVYKGRTYLTTRSHLRLAWSADGVHFEPEPRPALVGQGPHETFGIEDCRVIRVDGAYRLAYSAISDLGVGIGMASTIDWRTFERQGLMLPAHNKDCALFPQRIGSFYWAIHRASGIDLGGHYMWTARSPDLLHWGDHRCLATTRPGLWDGERIGVGAEPIRTPEGWLVIYHGAGRKSRYCLGAMLLDSRNPGRLIGRTRRPILEPTAGYERHGFFPNVVFSNGHVVDGDQLTLYYGAADWLICGARVSIRSLVNVCLEDGVE
jgi:predicted GH43/DUF377 family glycosyl hydrolase